MVDISGEFPSKLPWPRLIASGNEDWWKHLLLVLATASNMKSKMQVFRLFRWAIVSKFQTRNGTFLNYDWLINGHQFEIETGDPLSALARSITCTSWFEWFFSSIPPALVSKHETPPKPPWFGSYFKDMPFENKKTSRLASCRIVPYHIISCHAMSCQFVWYVIWSIWSYV